MAKIDPIDLRRSLKFCWLSSVNLQRAEKSFKYTHCKKLDLHKKWSNLSNYGKKDRGGGVGQAKRDVIKWAAFSKWDKMGRR